MSPLCWRTRQENRRFLSHFRGPSFCRWGGGVVCVYPCIYMIIFPGPVSEQIEFMIALYIFIRQWFSPICVSAARYQLLNPGAECCSQKKIQTRKVPHCAGLFLLPKLICLLPCTMGSRGEGTMASSHFPLQCLPLQLSSPHTSLCFLKSYRKSFFAFTTSDPPAFLKQHPWQSLFFLIACGDVRHNKDICKEWCLNRKGWAQCSNTYQYLCPEGCWFRSQAQDLGYALVPLGCPLYYPVK